MHNQFNHAVKRILLFQDYNTSCTLIVKYGVDGRSRHSEWKQKGLRQEALMSISSSALLKLKKDNCNTIIWKNPQLPSSFFQPTWIQ